MPKVNRYLSRPAVLRDTIVTVDVSSITPEQPMRSLWRARSNPLAWWWVLLTLVSSGNIALWFLLYRQFHIQSAGGVDSASDIQFMLLLCAAYVFGCAFRSFLPRAD